ncbi:MAG: hypothetical protein Q4C77_07155 [Eubacteriales bacterium]|nr:hypothetical protein [Eubacteriales bacterium]
MGKINVKDSCILSKCEEIGLDGKKWKQLEIAWDDESFEPGQFLMAAGKKMAVNWPKPFLLQEKTERGFHILIQEENPCFDWDEGDPLTVWGICGKEIAEGVEKRDKTFAAVADPAGMLLLLPFLRRYGEMCTGIYIAGDRNKENEYKTWISGALGKHLEERCRCIENCETFGEAAKADYYVAALPLEKIGQLKKGLPQWMEEKLWIFTGVKVGCGIGACRGCYIHVEGEKHGIPVCQEGPFLPIGKIRYKQDQNFLMHFV